VSSVPHPRTVLLLSWEAHAVASTPDLRLEWRPQKSIQPVLNIWHIPSGQIIGTLTYYNDQWRKGWFYLDANQVNWWGRQRFHQAVQLAGRLYPDGKARNADCVRCGTDLTDGRCQDVSCPFSDHTQECPSGWQGHPEAVEVSGAARGQACTCR